jgi:hypothetical protein
VEVLELGVPAIAVATDAFAALAHFEARSWGWDVPVATMAHPLGGVPSGELESRADQIAAFVDHQLTSSSDDGGAAVDDDVPPRLVAPADPWSFFELVQARGWGDGLPVFAPTPARVARMLAAHDVAPDLPVGAIPPARLEVTAQDVAVNAVLAGCADEVFPVVLAAVRACLQDQFNLLGILATTHPCGVAVLVSGPIGDRLGMNAAASAFGPGNRANATLGRAVRLALQNLGHAWPGPVDKSTQGHPAKVSYCVAENRLDSPWPAYHVDRGFDPNDSTVTVVAAEGPHNMHDPASTTADGLIAFIAGSMTHAGHNNLYHKGDLFLVLCPEHAGLFADAGWSKARIRSELFERTRLSPSRLGREAFDHFVSRWPGQPVVSYEDDELEIVARPEDINIVVAGGPGKHSCWLPTFGQSFSAIERVAGISE